MISILNRLLIPYELSNKLLLMNKQQRKELKKTLQERIEETTEEIDTLRELTKPVAPDKAIGRLTRMDAINNKAINEKALHENLSKLQKLKRALEHIDEEDFDHCSKCGKEIAFGRLKFMPWTSRCVDCA